MIMRWSGRVPSSKVAIVHALTPHRSTKESTMQRHRFSSFIPFFAGAALCTGAAWASSPGPQPVSPPAPSSIFNASTSALPALLEFSMKAT